MEDIINLECKYYLKNVKEDLNDEVATEETPVVEKAPAVEATSEENKAE